MRTLDRRAQMYYYLLMTHTSMPIPTAADDSRTPPGLEASRASSQSSQSSSSHESQFRHPPAPCHIPVTSGHFRVTSPNTGQLRVTPCNAVPKLNVTKCDTKMHISGAIDSKAGAKRTGRGRMSCKPPSYPSTITRFRCSSMAHRASGPTKTVDSRSSTIAGPLTAAPGSRP